MQVPHPGACQSVHHNLCVGLLALNSLDLNPSSSLFLVLEQAKGVNQLQVKLLLLLLRRLLLKLMRARLKKQQRKLLLKAGARQKTLLLVRCTAFALRTAHSSCAPALLSSV